jgi:hypothetical protein
MLTHLKIGGGVFVDWPDLTQDRNRWQALVNAVMDLKGSLKTVGNFLTS